jgi:hypothetical protein
MMLLWKKWRRRRKVMHYSATAAATATVHGRQKWKVRKVGVDEVRWDDVGFGFVRRVVEAWENDGNRNSLVSEVALVHHHT